MGDVSLYVCVPSGVLARSWNRDCYFIAEQPAPVPHLACPEGRAALRMVLDTVPRISRSCERFPDGFDLHLLHTRIRYFSRPMPVFFTLVTGPRRSLSLKLSDTSVCEP